MSDAPKATSADTPMNSQAGFRAQLAKDYAILSAIGDPDDPEVKAKLAELDALLSEK